MSNLPGAPTARLPPSARSRSDAFLSYAPKASCPWQQSLIRGIESLTGARRLNALYRQAQQRVSEGSDPWAAALEVLGIR